MLILQATTRWQASASRSTKRARADLEYLSEPRGASIAALFAPLFPTQRLPSLPLGEPLNMDQSMVDALVRPQSGRFFDDGHFVDCLDPAVL
jgi:hypothetical protein